MSTITLSKESARIAALMEQEGCGGCAENLVCAIISLDNLEAVRVVMESLKHIEAEGYCDGQAFTAMDELRWWAARVAVNGLDEQD